SGSPHDLESVHLVEIKGDLVTSGGMGGVDRFASADHSQSGRHHHELGSATIGGDSLAVGDRALEQVVLFVVPLCHCDFSSTLLFRHQSRTTRVSTRDAVSISSTCTNSSAACARAMSPGPKQTVGTPASLRSAASVHAERPSIRTGIPSRSRAALNLFTIGESTDTSLGSWAVLNVTRASSLG